jgi:hypothetical protein
MKKQTTKRLSISKLTIRTLGETDLRQADIAGASGDRCPQSVDTCSDRCGVPKV